jgi:hypothetical protein
LKLKPSSLKRTNYLSANDCHATQTYINDWYATQNFYTATLCCPSPLHTEAVDNIPTYYNCNLIAAIMIAVADVFPTIQEAKDSINRYILDEGELYRVYKSDKIYYIVVCKDSACDFKIRALFLKKKGIQITIIIPYSCNPTIYYKNKQSSAL